MRTFWSNHIGVYCSATCRPRGSLSVTKLKITGKWPQIEGERIVHLPWVQGSFQTHEDHIADCDESEDLHPRREKESHSV